MPLSVPRLQLGRRLRLVKLLRAHGLRHAERMREDELKAALDKLPVTLDERPEPSDSKRAPSSEAHQPAEESKKKAPVEPVIDPRWDDPYAAPRYLEPKVRLPEGERTFLRLIAVDARRLLVTWDLSAQDRARAVGGVKLRIDILNDERPPIFHDVDLLPGRWYIPAPGTRLALEVSLVTRDGDKIVASNPAIVPPSAPAPDGEIIYATLPIDFDRRQLAAWDLLDQGGHVPGASEQVNLESAGTTAGSENPAEGMPTSADVPLRGKPVSGRVERRTSLVMPSSHTVSSHHMPHSGSRVAMNPEHSGKGEVN